MLCVRVAMLLVGCAHALLPIGKSAVTTRRRTTGQIIASLLPDPNEPELFNGYTAKQRLREEIDSPFRKVRLVFFGFSTASAAIALYFSAIATMKGLVGGWSDTAPLNESMTNIGVNSVALLVCASLTLNDLKAGEANLARIQKGGALAALRVNCGKERRTLSDFRQSKRVVLAVGGSEYIETLATSLADPELAERLDEVSVIVVPVKLDSQGRTVAVDDFPLEADIVATPMGLDAWNDYLESELETAAKQGFDVNEKGIGIYVKMNGRILRRATGQPQWDALVRTMDVMDGNKFGKPTF